MRGGRSDARTVARRIGLASILLRTGLTVRLSALQCPDGSPPPCRAAAPRAVPAPPPNSVAVLYFDNLSRDTADAYLADGLTEELIVRLGQIGRLAVKSRSAAQRFRGRRADDPAALGRVLGVAYLVNGSVRRAGTRLRVTVNLVRASSGLQLWGEQYDRENADVLAIEEDVARAVATAIAGRLLPGERASLAARPTREPTAYDHFLRGNYALAQRNPRALARAIAEYEAAARLDPGFAAALARTAYAYGLYLDWAWEYPGVPAESVLARGFGAADRALREDSTASDAWMAIGYLRTFRHPRTFENAKAAFERAIALDPRNAEAHHQFGSILRWLGEDAAAAETFARARPRPRTGHHALRDWPPPLERAAIRRGATVVRQRAGDRSGSLLCVLQSGVGPAPTRRRGGRPNRCGSLASARAAHRAIPGGGNARASGRHDR